MWFLQKHFKKILQFFLLFPKNSYLKDILNWEHEPPSYYCIVKVTLVNKFIVAADPCQNTNIA